MSFDLLDSLLIINLLLIDFNRQLYFSRPSEMFTTAILAVSPRVDQSLTWVYSILGCKVYSVFQIFRLE